MWKVKSKNSCMTTKNSMKLRWKCRWSFNDSIFDAMCKLPLVTNISVFWRLLAKTFNLCLSNNGRNSSKWLHCDGSLQNCRLSLQKKCKKSCFPMARKQWTTDKRCNKWALSNQPEKKNIQTLPFSLTPSRHTDITSRQVKKITKNRITMSKNFTQNFTYFQLHSFPFDVQTETENLKIAFASGGGKKKKKKRALLEEQRVRSRDNTLRMGKKWVCAIHFR